MSDGFLGRWSKRKLEAKEGKAVADKPPREPSLQPSSQPLPASEAANAAAVAAEPPAPPPPTLEDVQLLTAHSDFRRFVAADVTPEVKNAAMKKLFADPRYNVMDGLDVYTGDYSQPDPLPAAMLQQLASSKFLGLFDEPKETDGAATPGQAPSGPRDVADNPTGQTVAQSPPALPAVPEPLPHADPDLRLQQDHAAAGKDPGRGAG